MAGENELETIEMRLLLEGVFQRYGFDFRAYAPASFKRRILKCIQEENVSTISGLTDKVLRDPACMERLLLAVSVDVTAMFRDPGFYLALRKEVVPLLRTYPSLRIWHAGCSTGEEAYSVAILLKEEGLYERARIYATDMSKAALKKAKEGIFPLRAMKDYTENYLQAGGTKSLSEYYTANYNNAIFSRSLQEKFVWAEHNLVTDASFNEFNVILCRNVLIYFNQALQARVHTLLYESLAMLGVLALGSKESIEFTPYEANYKALDKRERLYQKVK